MKLLHAGASLSTLLLLAAEPGPSERVVSGTALVDVRVNDEAAVLRIDPAAPAMPLINSQLAEAAHLKTKGGWGSRCGFASIRTMPARSRPQARAQGWRP